jgi:hypothetical protein
MFEIDARDDAKPFHMDPEWAQLFPQKAAQLANDTDHDTEAEAEACAYNGQQ